MEKMFLPRKYEIYIQNDYFFLSIYDKILKERIKN